MGKLLSAVGCAAALMGTQAAWADTLLGELHLIQGKVLVSTGKGFGLSGAAQTGDRILVGQGSSAVLSLPNGCDVQLLAGQIYVVPAISPCAVAAQPPTQAAPPPTSPPPPPLPAVAAPSLETSALIAGGVLGTAALGGVAYLLFVSRN